MTLLTGPAAILLGARFRIRDRWPFGLRFLTMHLTPWKDNARRLRCGAIDSSTPVLVYLDRDKRPRWHGRLNAGHATIEGRFAPSLDVVASEPYATAAEAMAAADAAMLAWFRDRIADGSVIYPWPAPVDESQTLMFPRSP